MAKRGGGTRTNHLILYENDEKRWEMMRNKNELIDIVSSSKSWSRYGTWMGPYLNSSDRLLMIILNVVTPFSSISLLVKVLHNTHIKCALHCILPQIANVNNDSENVESARFLTCMGEHTPPIHPPICVLYLEHCFDFIYYVFVGTIIIEWFVFEVPGKQYTK